jgi:hypothetical protein
MGNGRGSSALLRTSLGTEVPVLCQSRFAILSRLSDVTRGVLLHGARPAAVSLGPQLGPQPAPRDRFESARIRGSRSHKDR